MALKSIGGGRFLADDGRTMERLKEFYVLQMGSQNLQSIAASATDIVEQSPSDPTAAIVIGATTARIDTSAAGVPQVLANSFAQSAQIATILVRWEIANKFFMGGSGSVQMVPIANLYGTGTQPHLLRMMMVIPAGQIFRIRCNNLSATAWWLYLSHEGYREYANEYVEV